MSLLLTLETVSSVDTTLTIVTSTPSPHAGVAFTVSGKLSRNIDGAGLPGLTVGLYVDSVLGSSTATGSGGAYAFSVTINTPGSHTVQARFAGATWNCTGCEGTCQSACELDCQTGCEVSCQLSCQFDCKTTCQLSCQSACELACQGCGQTTCQTGCEVLCQGCGQTTCQAGCELGCQTSCEYSCKIGCQVVCQLGCQVACQTACELVSCQTSCQKVCQMSCEVDPK